MPVVYKKTPADYYLKNYSDVMKPKKIDPEWNQSEWDDFEKSMSKN